MGEYRSFEFVYDSELEKPYRVKMYREVDGKVVVDFTGSFETQEEAAQAFMSAQEVD
jgi:hypothetical protein